MQLVVSDDVGEPANEVGHDALSARRSVEQPFRLDADLHRAAAGRSSQSAMRARREREPTTNAPSAMATV